MDDPTIDTSVIRPIHLRLLTLENNLVMAPLAGVSNLPFRLIAREAGASLVYTETVSAKGLVMGGAKTRRLLDTAPREAPIAFQLFGSESEILGEAVRMLEGEGATWIDFNVGCPVKKFIRNGAGSSLLRDLPRAAKIIRSIRSNFAGTVTVKMRTGWDRNCIVAPEFARIAADEGAELLSVHGRTRNQQYTGLADRSIIKDVVEAVPDVPVLANGDITTPHDVFAMLSETGAAGVMIGRGAIGNPWIFEQTLALADNRPLREPGPEERYATVERHIALMEASFTNSRLFAANLKKYVAAYSKGLGGSARFRQETLEAQELHTILTLTREFFSRQRSATAA